MSYAVQGAAGGDSLADVLERILDKGIVIAGDVAISLVGIELLTIRLRLLVATVDKAREMGISWWETDPHLTGVSAPAPLPAPAADAERTALVARIAALEAQLAQVSDAGAASR